MTRPARDMSTLRAELLQWIAEHTQVLIQGFGVNSEIAEQIGCTLADDIADEWGGQVISVPLDHYYRMAQRDRAMLDAHRAGESLDSIARRTHVTLRTVQRIIKRAQLRDRDRMQPPLF